jgi:hypothetical protein
VRSQLLVECVKQIDLDHSRISPVILRDPCGKAFDFRPKHQIHPGSNLYFRRTTLALVNAPPV